MGKPKKKKPVNKLEIVKTVVEILAGIATIVSAIYSMFKGRADGAGNRPWHTLIIAHLSDYAQVENQKLAALSRVPIRQ